MDHVRELVGLRTQVMAMTTSDSSTSEEEIKYKGEGSYDRNADRRDARSRSQIIDRLLKDLDVDPRMAAAIKDDLSSLLPPQHRMSRAEDLVERLTALIDRDIKAPPPLLLSATGASLDVGSESVVRANERLAEAFESDEEVFRAYVANERLRGVLAGQLTSHDAARRVLVAELARRYSLAEQWRYKLPKYFLPVASVLIAAKVKRDDLRLGNKTLLGAIINLVVSHLTDSGVTKEDLVAAAQVTGDQFDLQLSEIQHAGEDLDATGDGSAEPFGHAEARLKARTDELRKAKFRAKGTSPDIEAEFEAHHLAQTAGAGIDPGGQIIFKGPQDFLEAVKYLNDQGHIRRLATRED